MSGLKDFDPECFPGRYGFAADPFDKLRAGSAAATLTHSSSRMELMG